ncbi:MAG TPA: hypothetical protein VK988_19555 [Acidimicrobiales bacterium]|nr:hypothetical protein [Acidimicrobiales bacterium]
MTEERGLPDAAVVPAEGSSARPTHEKPRLFISHRHDDSDIADVLRSFVNSRSGGRVGVFQSSSSVAEGPRIGRQLNKELMSQLWQANMLILLYTAPDQDWSYCMWECGVALDAGSANKRIVLFQCSGTSPSLFADQVRVDIRNLVDIQKFTNEFLTSPGFFPDYGQAITGFMPNSTEVLEAAQEFYDRLQAVAPPAAEGPEEWPAYPYFQLKLSAEQVRQVCEAPSLHRARRTQEILASEAMVSEADTEAARLFGLRGVIRETPFSKLLANWTERYPESDASWVGALSSQIAAAAQGQFPTQTWQLLRSVDPNDGTWYGPALIRVRDIPRERCMQFEVYLCKFSVDADDRVNVAVPKR